MTDIRVADSAGACYGVERALKMVERASLTVEGPLFTLGPLIHNPRVITDLSARGVLVAASPEKARGHGLILRTHGTTFEETQRARMLCGPLFDATCPFVKKMHKSVEQLVSEGYKVVVVGEKGHPEVEVTLSLAPGSVAIASKEEAASLVFTHKLGVVAQTTARLEHFEEVVGALVSKCDDLKVVNTICEATSTHQKSARELAQISDVMVIVGGRISANTTRLAEISAQYCAHTHHIEGADELVADWFSGAEVIGITAGASTPSYQIVSVKNAIERMCAHTQENKL